MPTQPVNRDRVLVFFGAHPDDETFGPATTLARYAAAGVKVYCVCSTDGEAGTVDPEHLKGYSSIKELRSAELRCAVKALGMAGLHYLGYRDSGMAGSETNKHPECMAKAPLEEVTGRVVKIMRQLKPDVIITHDPGGGYGHPDHIATHRAVVQAFYAAGDPRQFPEAGSAFQPGKLYFGVRPRGVMKLMVRLMPLWGQDPRHFGRNKDIDLVRAVSTEYPAHAVIKLNKRDVEMRDKAAACHASQGGGRPMRGSPFWVLRMIDRIRGPRDYFYRVYPSAADGHKEKDLFQGI
jgi:LmbE family N-acetylglucosaminyl deacetylase